MYIQSQKKILDHIMFFSILFISMSGTINVCDVKKMNTRNAADYITLYALFSMLKLNNICMVRES